MTWRDTVGSAALVVATKGGTGPAFTWGVEGVVDAVREAGAVVTAAAVAIEAAGGRRSNPHTFHDPILDVIFE